MLTSATKNTKAHLSRLGAFTSSSMHAYVLVKSSGKMRSSCSSPIRPIQQQQLVQQDNHRQLQNYSKATSTPASPLDDHRNSTNQQSSPTVNQSGKLFKSRASLVQITLPNQQVSRWWRRWLAAVLMDVLSYLVMLRFAPLRARIHVYLWIKTPPPIIQSLLTHLKHSIRFVETKFFLLVFLDIRQQLFRQSYIRIFRRVESWSWSWWCSCTNYYVFGALW